MNAIFPWRQRCINRATLASVEAVAALDGAIELLAGWYRLPSTDALEREEWRFAGFISDAEGNWTRIDPPGSVDTRISDSAALRQRAVKAYEWA